MRRLAAAVALCAMVPLRAVSQQPAATTPQAAVDTTVLPPQDIGTIAVAQTRTGMLENGDYTMSDGTYCDIWYFTATAGQRVVIELRSRRFDSYLQLLDPFGGKLAENDDGGRGMERGDSRIEFTVRDAGRYQIVVNNFGDTPREGVYTLTLR